MGCHPNFFHCITKIFEINCLCSLYLLPIVIRLYLHLFTELHSIISDSHCCFFFILPDLSATFDFVELFLLKIFATRSPLFSLLTLSLLCLFPFSRKGIGNYPERPLLENAWTRELGLGCVHGSSQSRQTGNDSVSSSKDLSKFSASVLHRVPRLSAWCT